MRPDIPDGIFEIVPNISEGRDLAIVDRIADAASSVANVLHRTSDPVHNRSVLTIAGNGRDCLEAALRIAEAALHQVDLRRHTGVHPRIGALDVLPFVPLQGTPMAAAVALAHSAGRTIWERYGIPCYFYGAAASVPERVPLPAVRSARLKPDVGDIDRHESAGAIAIGARDILIAFNVVLATGDLSIAKEIAREIRERNGGLRTLRALGFRLDDQRVQVSLNVTDYEATPLHRIVELIRMRAAAYGVSVRISELVGCLPSSAVEVAARYYLGVP